MKIFTGNDEFLTPEFVMDSLRELAREEGEKGEYPPEEHIGWIAAEMIDHMNNALDGKAPHFWLREIAEKMKWDYITENLGKLP
jgi:hypothetical protein